MQWSLKGNRDGARRRVGLRRERRAPWREGGGKISLTGAAGAGFMSGLGRGIGWCLEEAGILTGGGDERFRPPETLRDVEKVEELELQETSPEDSSPVLMRPYSRARAR
mmetsp:Transcript_6712/g.13964  ORF Transcript_6712/g.13964 Transcript_6712/m.13964 type:complete len:109 (-) Transcript_6712:252-578(-)